MVNMYLVRADLNCVNVSIALGDFGSVFHSRGANTANDSSYLVWNFALAVVVKGGTLANRPRRWLLKKWIFKSLGAMFVNILYRWRIQ